MNLPAILPLGTQVVTLIEVMNPVGETLQPLGAVGVIVHSPADATHAYRVRFNDGSEHALKRREITVRSHHQDLATKHETQADLYPFVIYRCIIGSRAYGLSHEASDVDIRGFFLPPAERHWCLFGVPEQLERGEEAYWELEKFLLLALKANPNILECLYTPFVEYATPLAEELIGMRHIFLSKLIYQTYSGYVASQFRKLQKDLENYGSIRWKHAMHLIRLLLAGITALRDGELSVEVTEHRAEMLAIRRGEMGWAEVDAWRLRLHHEFDTAFQRSKLPERPDFEAANAYLLRARRSMVGFGQA